MNFCPQCGKPMITAERGGRDRSICPDENCGYIFWNNPTPVVAAIVERNNHILLVQSIGWPKNWYALVTGFLESNETPEEAVLREVKEETGLDGKLESFIGTYPFFRMNQLLLIYHVTAHEGEIILDREELADYREVPIEDVRPWDSGTGHGLNDFLRSRGYTPEFIQLRR